MGSAAEGGTQEDPSGRLSPERESESVQRGSERGPVPDEQTQRVPIEPGFFTTPEDGASPRLLGSRCGSCREVFFPRRRICAACEAAALEDVELGPRGTLYTYTWVHMPLFGALRAQAGSYGVGQVDLAEGPRVQAVLAVDREELAIGMELELQLETLRREDDGTEVMIFRFGRPS